MFNPRRARTFLAAVLSVAACLIGSSSAFGVCARVVCRSQPSACPIGPYACIPMSPWGYYPRQWRPWPGQSVRQDIVYPQSLGVEAIARPRGTKPKPLPKEKYGKPKRLTDRTIEIEISKDPPVEPIATPRPLDFGPDWGQDDPGPGARPQGPSLK